MKQPPSARILRLAVLFAAAPLALLTAYATGSPAATVAVFVLVVAWAILMRWFVRGER
jgi:uncharacterized membrane protein YdbT with pleckstrin-like domain